MLKLIDLFSGVGGLSRGFEMAGFEPNLAIEFDAQITESYAHNNPHSRVLNADISDINIQSEFRGCQGNDLIIVGGPPCQGFSQKGKRLGLNDERNFLIRQYLEIVAFTKPFAVVIENVPGILSSENGFFLEQIENTLRSNGYLIEHRILNAVDYGVPQLRTRAFIIGIKKIKGLKPFQWPTPNIRPTTVEEAIFDLPVLKSGEGKSPIKFQACANSNFQLLMHDRDDGLLYNHIATNHSKTVLERLAMIPENGGRDSLPSEHLTKSIYSGTWTRLRSDKPARTITTRFDTPSSGMFTLPTQDRCLTVREAARLQSFPDSFEFLGNKSNQMLQVGNAVPPLLAKAIANSIVKVIP